MAEGGRAERLQGRVRSREENRAERNMDDTIDKVTAGPKQFRKISHSTESWHGI